MTSWLSSPLSVDTTARIPFRLRSKRQQDSRRVTIGQIVLFPANNGMLNCREVVRVPNVNKGGTELNGKMCIGREGCRIGQCKRN